METNVAAQIGVVIADRLTFFRRGMAALLQESRPGWTLNEADSYAGLLAHLHCRPDLVLLDLSLPGLGGIDGIGPLRALCPHSRIVVMADDDDSATILRCLTAGAQGYVLKTATPVQFQRALDTVLSGGVFAPASLTGVPLRVQAVAPRIDLTMPRALATLTDRQRDVFGLLAEGCSTKAIARRLDLAVGTVKVHLAAIYRVMGARSRLEAMAKAFGGLPLPPPAAVAQEIPARERLN